MDDIVVKHQEFEDGSKGITTESHGFTATAGPSNSELVKEYTLLDGATPVEVEQMVKESLNKNFKPDKVKLKGDE